MKDLREEVVTKACMVGGIVKNRIKWAGHMVRMNDLRQKTRSLQNMRKMTGERGGLCEERSKKG